MPGSPLTGLLLTGLLLGENDGTRRRGARGCRGVMTQVAIIMKSVITSFEELGRKRHRWHRSRSSPREAATEKKSG